MSYVIRKISAPGRSARADEADAVTLAIAGAEGTTVLGDYLEWSDPNAKFGRGDDGWTSDLAKAKKFATFDAAMKCWKQQSTLVPTRLDGKPNRPLTAYSVSVEEIT